MPEGTDPQPAPTPPAGPPAWSRLHLWQIQWVRDVLIVVLIVFLFWLGQRISVVTVPLLLALLLAYLFEPVIQWLMRRTRLERQGAVTAIIAAVVIGVVIPAAIGAVYGVVQAVGILDTIAQKTGVVWTSVESGRNESTLEHQLQIGKDRREDADAESGAATDDRAGEEPGSEPGAETPPQEPGAAQAEPNAKLDIAAGDVPTPEQIEKLESELSSARIKAAEDLERLQENAPRWAKLRDFLVKQHEEGSLDEGFQAFQRWLRANADQIAGTAASTGANVIQTTLRFFAGAFGLLFMLFLTAFFFFFMSTGWVGVKGFATKLMPDRNKDLILHLLTEFDRVISAFIRGRLTIAFIQSLVFTTGYFLIGVPAAFILGPIIAVLSIVPYLALVGLPVAILLLWVENHTGLRGHWLWVVGAPTAFYFFAQALDDYVWTPWIQGKSTDMSTPMILFASLAGGVLFGVFGLLIAIPIAACIKILVQELFWPHFKRWTEGEEEDFLPIARERRKT